MPVQSWGHSQYWQGAPAAPETPPQTGTSRGGGYPAWQATVIIGSLFGVLQVLYERIAQKGRR